MHNVEDIGLVELATISFGQSFQVTPVQMATTVSSLVNGGYRVTPHFGVAVLEKDGTEIRKLKYKKKNGIVSEKTSETMRILLKSVVEEGSGKNGYIEGYSIGGKTATSSKKRKQIYFIIYRVCTGGRSAGSWNCSDP